MVNKKILLLAVTVEILCVGLAVACPLMQVPFPSDLTGYTKYETPTVAAEQMILYLRTKVEEGQVAFVDESYRTPFINKLEAVLNMLKAGSINGVIQKIRKDLQDKDLKWVAESDRRATCEFLEAATQILETAATTYYSYW
ncbi:MAG: hypothetical protein AB1393_14515 [Candidatus Edwardsbacteria bacterium]